MKVFTHIAIWLVIIGCLTLIFENSFGSHLMSFYFIAMLLPIIAGTFYFLNYYLIPRFLLKKKYLQFGLYFFYSIVISLYLELLAMMFAYIFIVDFHLGRMEPYASDILFLAIVLYFIVFTGSFILFIRKYNESNVKIQELRKEKELNARGFLEVRSARKKVRIDYELLEYIESYSDYVKIHRTGMDPVMTRKKISHLDDALPESFLRVHRSFIVNSGHITAYNYEKIELGDKELPISRSYKQSVMAYLNEFLPSKRSAATNHGTK